MELFQTIDLEPLNEYCQLKSLSIGGNNIRIEQIVKNKTIEELFLFERIKDVKLIGQMLNLKKLTFSKMTFRNLDFLKDLDQLTELNFVLGGTKNLEALPKIGKINEISFTWVRLLKMENLSPLNEMKFLKKITFDRLPHLLNLNWLNNKKNEVKIINCKNYKNKPYS